MSTNHHTAVSGTALVNAPITNAPYSQLDSIITQLLTGIEQFDLLQLGEPADVTETYDSANVDTDVELRGHSGAGGSTDTNGTGSNRLLGDSGGVEVWRAQSFQVTAGILSQIQIAHGANTGSPAGSVTWKIMADNAGNPTGTQLATGTYTPTASSNNTINVSNGPFLSASTTYWLRLEGAAQGVGIGWGLTSGAASSYANGTASTSLNSGSSWTPDSWDFDMVFVTSAVVVKDKLAQGTMLDEAALVDMVQLRLKKTGTPTGNLTLKIQTDSAGSPSGTPVTNGTSNTVAASTLSSSYGWIDFVFALSPTLDANTQYHLVLETADSASNTNYVNWGADASAPAYTGGVMKSEQSSSWVAESKDAAFVLTGTVGANGAALVELHSTTQGALPPRMTTTQRDAIVSPDNGDLIFNITTGLLNLYADGWIAIAEFSDTNAIVELIAPTSVTGQTSVNVAVPTGYKHVILRLSAQGNVGGASPEMRLQINSDTGNNYKHIDGVIGGSQTSTPVDGGLDILTDNESNDMFEYEITFFNYLDTGNFRGILYEAQLATDAADLDLATASSVTGHCYWMNTADAISSIQIKEPGGSSWDGSFSLYGIL